LKNYKQIKEKFTEK